MNNVKNEYFQFYTIPVVEMDLCFNHANVVFDIMVTMISPRDQMNVYRKSIS